jgi:uncharacterized protein YbcI
MSERSPVEGDTRANISRRMVQLHKEFYGKGPTRAKTYINGDLVVVLMRGGFTRVEETLLQEGRGDSVVQQRADFQDVMVDRFKEVVEGETGRKVVAMMSGSHQHPDLLGEVFVLESTDLFVGDDASGPSSTPSAG